MRIVSSTLIIFWILPSILCGLYDRNACKLYRNCACNRQKTAFCKYRIALEAIQFIKYKNTTLTQKQSLNSVKNWQRYSGFCACLYALPLCLGGKVHSTFFPLRAYLHKYSIYFPRVEGVRCSHSLVIAFLGTRTPLSLYYMIYDDTTNSSQFGNSWNESGYRLLVEWSNVLSHSAFVAAFFVKYTCTEVFRLLYRQF